MTSPRLLLAAGSIAATLAGIVPVLSHDGASGKPLQVGPHGVAVAVQSLPVGKAADATVVVPAGAKALRGTRGEDHGRRTLPRSRLAPA